MNASVYLEQAKIEEIAAKLLAEGYEVRRQARLGDLQLDLVARRGKERIAYEVKARPVDQAGLEQVRELRRRALAQGFADFRFVIVAPPQWVDVEVESLEDQLFESVARAQPSQLNELLPGARLISVYDLVPVKVHICGDGIRYSGEAVAEFETPAGAPDDQPHYPVMRFSFDATLDPQARVTALESIEFDASSLWPIPAGQAAD